MAEQFSADPAPPDYKADIWEARCLLWKLQRLVQAGPAEFFEEKCANWWLFSAGAHLTPEGME